MPHQVSEAKLKNRLKARGIVRYNPVRTDVYGRPIVAKNEHKTRTMIIDLPNDDLDDYYRWFIQREYGQALGMSAPMWGTHITVVRPHERPSRKLSHLWGKHEGKEVEFKYAPVPMNYWAFWALPVFGQDLQDLRVELGLPQEDNLHITIGRQYDWVPAPAHARGAGAEIRKQMSEQGYF